MPKAAPAPPPPKPSKAKSPKAKPKAKPATPAAPAKRAPPSALYSSFRALPLALPVPVPVVAAAGSAAPSFKAGASVVHHLFCRPNALKPAAAATASDEDKERAARTLFVANIPVDAGEHELRTLFGRWGVVETVDMQKDAGGDVLEAAVCGLPSDSDSEDDDDDDAGGDGDDGGGDAPDDEGWTFVGTAPKEPRRRRRREPKVLPPSVPSVAALPPLSARATPLGASGGRTSKVVYVDAVSVGRAMGYTGAPLEIPGYGADPTEPSGLAYYTASYASHRPSLAAVRAHADTAMARHDHLHSLLLSSRAKAHGAGALVDEDGFTVVVRGGRYGRTAGRTGDAGGAGVAVAARGFAKDAADKKKSRGAGELKDFYKFQSVDRKRKELANMRARFEDDKKKVEELKRARRFKPY